MQDFVPNGTGNSRYLKSVENFKMLYPTYDDFVAALVDGTLPVDFNGINMSGIAQIGTALNKATLLTDATAAMYGLGGDAVPDDVFMALKIPSGYYGFTVNAKFEDGTPAAQLELLGLFDFNLNTAITGDDGFCYALANTLTPTVDFTRYVGIGSKTVPLQVDESLSYTHAEITVEKDTGLVLFETSGDVRTYRLATIDVCAVGGGGGGAGGSSYNSYYGGGGGGGYAVNVLGLQGGTVLSCTIGAGGRGAKGAAHGTAGGATKVVADGETIATANGGDRGGFSDYGDIYGSGNGVGGGKSRNAGNGTVYVFNDDTLPLPGGGGACTGSPGKDFGGATWSAGTGPGGGGGGALSEQSAAKNGGNGHAGGVYMRARFE